MSAAGAIILVLLIRNEKLFKGVLSTAPQTVKTTDRLTVTPQKNLDEFKSISACTEFLPTDSITV